MPKFDGLQNWAILVHRHRCRVISCGREFPRNREIPVASARLLPSVFAGRQNLTLHLECIFSFSERIFATQ